MHLIETLSLNLICGLIIVTGLCGSPVLFIKKFDLHNSKADSKNLRIVVCNLLTMSFVVFAALTASIQSNIVFSTCSIFLVINSLSFFADVILRRNYRDFRAIFISTLLAITQLIPALSALSRNRIIFGMTASMNNDVADYALVSDNTLQHGFRNLSRIYDYNLGDFAKNIAYQSTNFLQASVSREFRMSTVAVSMLILISGLALANHAFVCAARILNPAISEFNAFAIATICFGVGLSNYIVSNYFLGEVFGFIIIGFLISEFGLTRTKTAISYFTYTWIGLALGLGIYTYPPMMIILFPVIGVAFFTADLKNKKLDFSKIFIAYLWILIVSILVTIPYIRICFNGLVKTNSAKAGWPFPPLNAISVILWPNTIGIPSGNLLVISSWVALFIFGLFLLQKAKLLGSGHPQTIIYLTSFLIFLFFILAMGRSAGDYQSWKMQSYLIPIVMLVLLNASLSHSKIQNSLTYLLLGAVLIIPSAQWVPDLKRFGNVTTTDLQTMATNRYLKNFSHLNINLHPYFETMAMATILSNKVLFLNSPSYLNLSENQSLCTLTRTEYINGQKFIPISENYVLADSKDGTCQARYAANL